MIEPGIGQRLFIALQYLLPHHAISAIVYHAMRWRWRPWKNFLIRFLSARFDIDIEQAASGDPNDYEHFNAFFTRALKPGVRPIAESGIVCPADGAVSQCGRIESGRIFQAKGQWFDVSELLAGAPDAGAFEGGRFATIYLSPRDYHRVHMPWAGKLVRTRYVPGRLYSVAPLTVSNIPRLFARNERIVCCFESELGRFVQVLVGAINVSAMETVWAGEIPGSRHIREETWTDRDIRLDRGAEMGRFNMGSTVIMLFEPGKVEWDPDFIPGAPLLMGQRIGHSRAT